MKEEPEYYKSNGLSPIGAFEQGLLSEEEYIGFVKGNIIKYIVRAGKKNGEELKDYDKAIHYIEILKNYCNEKNKSKSPMLYLSNLTFNEKKWNETLKEWDSLNLFDKKEEE